MSKLNCWEVLRCGRESDGQRVSELGVCKAATETKLNGTNDGKNRGRACWAITGTLCGEEVPGTFASKLHNCLQCEFYQSVRKEEGPEFQAGAVILTKLKT
jgi:hypothetical protein